MCEYVYVYICIAYSNVGFPMLISFRFACSQAKREALLSLDKKLSELGEARSAKDDEMKELEKSLVQVLVEQQKKLLVVLNEVGLSSAQSTTWRHRIWKRLGDRMFVFSHLQHLIFRKEVRLLSNLGSNALDPDGLR